MVRRRHPRVASAAQVIASFVGPFGLYLHVPFCRSICPFCPYNKVLLRGGLAGPYFSALRRELDRYGVSGLRLQSLYVGGGTPSLCLGELGPLVRCLDVVQERAIEVMPNHVSQDFVDRLHDLAFDYVSLGLQSFDPRILRYLGRLNTAEDNRRALASTVGDFACVNADLIFDVAFVESEVFLRDFEECCRAHVDQISTYPLMHFGYTLFGTSPHRPQAEHELLRRTCELAEGLGYERRSVWTFTRVGSPLYASIARELYLGCGAGAATFTGTSFAVNHFGLAVYERALAAGRLPIARCAPLGSVRAALYYAFWQLYAPGIDLDRFERLFPGARVVTPLLRGLEQLGCLEARGGRLHLTERSFDHYHDLERWVTYHLIEPLWEEMLEEHPVHERPCRRTAARPEPRRAAALLAGRELLRRRRRAPPARRLSGGCDVRRSTSGASRAASRARRT